MTWFQQVLIPRGLNSAMTQAQALHRRSKRRCHRVQGRDKVPGQALLAVLACPSLLIRPDISPGKVYAIIFSDGFATCQQRPERRGPVTTGHRIKVDYTLILLCGLVDLWTLPQTERATAPDIPLKRSQRCISIPQTPVLPSLRRGRILRLPLSSPG